MLSACPLVSCRALRAGAQQAPSFRAGVDLVNLGVTVTDRKGSLVTDLHGGRLRGLRGRQEADDPLFRRRRRPTAAARRCTSACCSTSARAWARTCASRKTAAIKFLNTLTDAVDITVVDFDTEVRVGALQPARVRAAHRADPPAEGERVHGALRRDRRLSRRRRRAGRPQDHAALHRRRRHAERAVVPRADRPAEGVRRHRLRDRRARAPVVVRRERAARRSCSRSPTTTGGQAFFPTSRRRSSTRSTTRCSRRSARSTPSATSRPTRRPTAPGARSSVEGRRARTARICRVPLAQGLLRACYQKSLQRSARSVDAASFPSPSPSARTSRSGTIAGSDAFRCTTASTSSPISRSPAISRARSASCRTGSSAATRTRCCSASPARARRSRWRRRSRA